jgi:flagellar protein FliL
MSQSPQETATPPAKARKKTPLLCAAAVAVLLCGAGVAKLTSASEKSAPSGAAGEHGAATVALPSVMSLAPFILNLADQEDERYLRLSVSIVLADAADATPLTDESPEHARLRDRILTVLSAKSADEIVSFEGKESLRAELQRQVAELLPERRVVDVLYTEFLVQ